MGDVASYIYFLVEEPLLWIVFLIFVIVIVIRIAYYLYVTIKVSKAHGRFNYKHILNNVVGKFLPFHRLLVKKPLLATLLYIFHICLLVVPIWLEGHIVLWEDSRFEWYWTPLPDVWADGMTLVFLTIAFIFFIRHIIVPAIRYHSTITDYLLMIITALPFLTGYFLSHGTLDAIAFLKNHMQFFHILSAEVMILMALVLFCTSRFDKQKCSACGSCALDCPTGAIQINDYVDSRVFRYAYYQCIACLACVKTCPEEAIALKHKIDFRPLLQTAPQEKRKVDLVRCNKCGVPFEPVSLVERVGSTVNHDHIYVCPRCKRIISAEIIYPLPLLKKLKCGPNHE